MVYELYDFPPNDVSYGWDGYFRGKKIQSGGFVCTVEWIDAEGELWYILSGDLTLLR